MKTIVLHEPGKFELTQTPHPGKPGKGEALVKVHKVGICGTDLHAYRGKQPFFSYPRILGHELGVEVIEIGEGVHNVKVGDKCAVEPYRNTTNDHAVRRGKTNCGENLSVLGVHEDGGMREYIIYPAKYLHPSSALSYEQLALVETLGIGCHAVNRAQLEKEDTVLVIGAGPIGLGAITFAKAAGVDIAVMDLNPDRLAFCRDALGVQKTLLASDSPEEDIRSLFGGDLPTVIFDVTGSSQSMHKTFELVAYGGKIIFIGLFLGDITFYDPYFQKKELTLMSSRNAQAKDLTQVLSAIESGQIDTSSWLTHGADMEGMIEKFDQWLKPESKVIKAVLSIG